MPYRSRRFALLALVLIVAWSVATYIVSHLVGLVGDTPFSARIVRSLIVGTWAGLLGAGLELGVMPRVSRRLPFWGVLTLRTILYAIVVLVAFIAVIRFIGRTEADVPLSELVQSTEFRAILTSGQLPLAFLALIGASFLINLDIQLIRVLGPGMLSKISLGRYLKPVFEDRVFLFLDLTDSTGIAEQLGPLKFSDFKNDFFYDIAEPILATGGQIFQYVGDEVVITWPMRAGLKRANCIYCFFRVQNQVEKRTEYYQKRYGLYHNSKLAVTEGR